MTSKKPAKGLRPLSKSERTRLSKENQKALFPDVVRQRYEETCRVLEDELEQGRTEDVERAALRAWI